MARFDFGQDQFSSLGFQSLAGGYNSIGLSDLSATERSVLEMFFEYLGEPSKPDADGNLDTENVLLVKANSAGILVNVYGPSIFRIENDLVLKCGANEWTVDQKNGSLRVGQLEGSISFADKPIAIKVKDDAGEEREIDFYPANVDFMPDDGEEIEYRVRCSWDAATEPKPASIKAALKKGTDISKYFRTVPTGNREGGETVKMQDLGDGEYQVSGIRLVQTKDYGDRFVVQLADGQEVWSRGMVDSQLKAGYQMRSGVELVLIIANCQQRANGKWYMDCALREKVGVATNETISVKPVASIAAPPKAEKQQVEGGGGKVAATIGAPANEVDYDDIPF